MKNCISLYFSSFDYQNLTDENEAVTKYQIARQKGDHLSLIGSGEGCAVCLMLASRFMPDELHLYPMHLSTVSSFLRAVSNLLSFPYFVCAPVKVYLGPYVTEDEKRRIKRLLMKLSSFQKEIICFEKANDLILSLSNQVDSGKALAQM